MRLTHLHERDSTRLVVGSGGGWVDAAHLVEDSSLTSLTALVVRGPETWKRVASAVSAGTPPACDGQRLAPLLDPTTRIFCVGRNYREHVAEFNNAAAPWPEIFLRLGSSLIAPGDDIIRPSVTQALDYEGELALIIGRGGRHIAAADGMDHIFGFTVANDVSVRDWQWGGRQWTSGKNFDGTLPVGPCVVTADEIDGRDLALTTRVNGETMQAARTSQFIFDLGEQIEFLSSFTELRPGDLICTGTPGGVGSARDPRVVLTDGDIVEVEIEGIGTIRNRVTDDRLRPATSRWQQLAAAK